MIVADRATGGERVAEPVAAFEREGEPGVTRVSMVMTSPDGQVYGLSASSGQWARLTRLPAVGDQLWMVYHAWSPDSVGSDFPGRTMWLSEVEVSADQVRVTPPTIAYPTRPLG